jgi:oligogalacturonide lyase
MPRREPSRPFPPLLLALLFGCGTSAGASPDAGPACIPSCAAKTCGTDGCGGTCGTCAIGDVCDPSGSCVRCDAGPAPDILPPEPTAAPSDDFVDATTGHRVVRLSRLEGSASNFYFHQNEFNCRGNKLVFANGHDPVGRALYSINLETYKVQTLAPSMRDLFELVGRKRNEVYYLGDDGSLRATNLDTLATRTVGPIAAGVTGFTINADETLFGGFSNEGIVDYQQRYPTTWFTEYFNAHKLSALYTIDVDTGATKMIHEEMDWLDHVQFSPVDPMLLMYAHEGPGDQLDRIWVIDREGATAPRSLYPRAVPEEFVSHELWQPDGKQVYYDHARWSKGYDEFFIGATDVATGVASGDLYPVAERGVHYNISHDGTLFASDGSYQGKKLLLYRKVAGMLQPEPLADLGANDYNTVEPNVQFTPDDRWVVFRSSQSGSAQVYAVAVER